MNITHFFASGILLFSAAAASAAECGYCHKPIQGTPYVLKSGTKTEPFKCVYCAVAEAHEEVKGDVTIISPSENPKLPVTIKRIGGKWKQFPTGATFVSASPIKHRMCDEQFRAFTSKTAAQKYIQTTGKATSTITLSQLVAQAD